MLCGIGGFLGILGGVGVAKLISMFSQWKAVVTLSSVLMSFGVACSVGIFFGFYPARQAAKMDPVEALRYE
jgi:putative ABC transport system permease protein